MTDPERTETNWQKYLRADGWLDRHLAPLLDSPLTLALFIAWTAAMVWLGWWAGR